MYFSNGKINLGCKELHILSVGQIPAKQPSFNVSGEKAKSFTFCCLLNILL